MSVSKNPHPFYRFGIYVIERVDKYNVNLRQPWIPFTCSAVVVPAVLLAELWTTTMTVCVAVVAIGIQIASSYLVASHVAAKQSIRYKERRHVWKKVARWTRDEHGLIAALNRLISEAPKCRTGAEVAAWNARVVSLQQSILHHIVRVAADFREISDDHALSANWCLIHPTEGVPETGLAFCVKCYDREMAARVPNTRRTHPIRDGIPGTSRAVLSNTPQLVRDTQAEEVREHFRENRPYRCILSIPVSLGEQTPIGVVNLDGTEPDLLRDDLPLILADLVHLVGLCETVSGWMEDQANGNYCGRESEP